MEEDGWISKSLRRACEICQQHKVEHLVPRRLLSPLPIPNQVWENISMDYLGVKANQWSWWRLTGYLNSHPYTATQIAKTFFGNILQLYGMPCSIVCDRDTICISKFWQELFRLQGVHFNMSSADHPQTNGQTEVVNRTFEMYLSCFCSSSPETWM